MADLTFQQRYWKPGGRVALYGPATTDPSPWLPTISVRLSGANPNPIGDFPTGTTSCLPCRSDTVRMFTSCAYPVSVTTFEPSGEKVDLFV